MTRRRYTYVPITADDLRALGACSDQVAQFAAWRPDGATPDDIDDALAIGLDVCWLASNLDAEPYAELRPRLDALNAEFRPRWDALNAEYWSRWDALNAEHWSRWDALWDALNAEFQSRQDALALDCLLACWPVWEVTP